MSGVELRQHRDLAPGIADGSGALEADDAAQRGV
jgi:hypothetical protein